MLAEAVQLASKCWLTLTVSTIGGNHSTNDPHLRQEHAQDKEGEENRQESSGSGVMKYECKHDIAQRSFLSTLVF